MTNKLKTALLLSLLAVGAQTMRNAVSAPSSTKVPYYLSPEYVAHRIAGSRKFWSQIKTTKGGVRYIVYTPVDDFGTYSTQQTYYWWVGEPWDGDDKPYADTRKAIDVTVRAGTKPSVLMARYKAQLASDPWNPRKVYPWAYAALLARKIAPDGNAQHNIIRPVADYMSEVPFPHSYQYARVMFLAQGLSKVSYSLRYVGDRLLQRNPHDNEVKFAMIFPLLNGKSDGAIYTHNPADDARALAYARNLHKAYPINEGYAWQYAEAVAYLWERPEKPRDLNKAKQGIAAFQQYLREYPNTKFRAAALAKIAWIKQRQHDWVTWERAVWEKEQAQQRAQP